MLYITLVDDETVQDDSEKEFLVYEGINFLMFYTLELIILVYLIKISLRAYYVTRHWMCLGYKDEYEMGPVLREFTAEWQTDHWYLKCYVQQ